MANNFNPQSFYAPMTSDARGTHNSTSSSSTLPSTSSSITLPSIPSPQSQSESARNTATSFQSKIQNAQQSYKTLPKSEPISNNKPSDTLPETGEIIFLRLDPYLEGEEREKYKYLAAPSLWKFYHNANDCENLLRSECRGKHVFLISSGQLSQQLVPTVHDLPQLTAVYIHCGDVELNKKWSCNFKKVKLVCWDDDKELFPQLFNDVMQMYVEIGDNYMREKKRDDARETYIVAMEKYGELFPENPKYEAFLKKLQEKMDAK
ncbi:unnamed protein product [Didymodactylos carnosus]|uniref:Uncharacterized protein n=1 Tax=Didymodactylos carnosus TaxID=1234261 RepID=A0A814NMP8_9BILA|nr:unnamed protein product [Didymodactylos carnosus]CAF1260358.1 unnamed protein product [Didymodactylos carnosus]CAF3858827.1 unnamed protein product [Didymodactylos carnosus]CAF4066940.1 unnamed protein product [Didymodactylos carnosus]